MNGSLRWYGRVVWLGNVANALFWVPALFYPDLISDVLGHEKGFHTVWLRNVGMLLILVGIFNAIAAHAPHRTPVLAWGVAAARIIASLFFLEVFLFNSHMSSDRPEVFGFFFLADFTFGVVMGALLQRGLPAEHRLSRANLRRLWAAFVRFPMFRGGPAD
jgi:hypothetical membrane protein